MLLNVLIQHRGRVSGVKGSTGGGRRRWFEVFSGDEEGGGRWRAAPAPRQVDHPNWPQETCVCSGCLSVCKEECGERLRRDDPQVNN